MELPPLLTPAPTPGPTAAGELVVDPGVPEDVDAGTPGFAELLAAGIAAPQLAPGTDALVELTGEGLLPATDAVGTDAPGEPAGETADPTLALVLAVIAGPVPGAATGQTAARATVPAAAEGLAPPAGAVPRSPARATSPAAPAIPVAAPDAPLPGAASATATVAAAAVPESGNGPVALISQMQAAAPSAQPAATAPAAAPPAEIRAPVGGNGWDGQVGRTVLWMTGEGRQIAEVRLNPPDLGPLEIMLHLAGEDGSQANVAFASPHAEVRAALEAALPRLRDMLAASGIALGQASVSAESQRDPNTGNPAAAGGSGEGPAVARGTPAPVTVASRGTGLVDLFA